jgi:hypothetical protein
MSALGKVAKVIAAVLAVPLAAAIAGWTASIAAGTNVSDVGVPMFERRGLAAAVGMVGFPLLSLVAVALISRSGDRRPEPVVTAGVIAFIVCAPIYYFAMAWGYG